MVGIASTTIRLEGPDVAAVAAERTYINVGRIFPSTLALEMRYSSVNSSQFGIVEVLRSLRTKYEFLHLIPTFIHERYINTYLFVLLELNY